MCIIGFKKLQFFLSFSLSYVEEVTKLSKNYMTACVHVYTHMYITTCMCTCIYTGT